MEKGTKNWLLLVAYLHSYRKQETQSSHFQSGATEKTETGWTEVLPLPFRRGGWLHRWWLHPARRPQLGSNAQPQIKRYGYVNLFEAFANLKRVLKRSCLNASEDIMGAPIMSLLIAIPLNLQTITSWLTERTQGVRPKFHDCEMSVKRDMSSK